MTALSSETVHASCVAIRGRAVLIEGRSGSGKSDLALRLIDHGAMLVSDDYTLLTRDGTRLIATPPPTIALVPSAPASNHCRCIDPPRPAQ